MKNKKNYLYPKQSDWSVLIQRPTQTYTDIEETIEATIPQFPVQVIGMEYCENTFDDLILSDELKDKYYNKYY